MTLQELYKLIDIDEPADLSYFEQLAELLETEEDIPFDQFYTALSGITAEDASEIMGNYMEQITEALPDETEELFTLISNMQQQILNLCEELESSGERRAFAEELYRFRQWLTRPDSVLVDGIPESVMEAVAMRRSEPLLGTEHKYDFDGALDYDLKEISMNLGSFSKIDVVKKPEDN